VALTRLIGSGAMPAFFTNACEREAPAHPFAPALPV
jgi:hypothetical protein